MKKKHLITLVAILLVLGLVYFVQHRTGTRLDAVNSEKKGYILDPEFNSENLQTIKINKNQQAVTLEKSVSGWTVKEKFGYPADFSKLKTLLFDLAETRIAQTLELADSQHADLSLTEENGASVMVMLDEKGKEVEKLIFGRKHENIPDSDDPYMMMRRGMTSGRYLQLKDGRCILAANSFGVIDNAASDWLNHDFLKISELKRVVLSDKNEAVWELTRVDKNAELQLTGAVPDEKEPDSTALSSIKNAFSNLRFSDIAGKVDEELKDYKQLMVEDFDGFVYNFKFSESDEKRFRLQVAVSWQGEKVRQIPANEKPEDGAAQDEAFNAAIKEKQQKARELQERFSHWLYWVEQYQFDTINKSRTQLLKDKPKPDKSEVEDPK